MAVVVIGGTLISGGRAVPVGVWGASVFFILLDGLVNLVGWSTAAQNLLKGGLVLFVLFLAGGGDRTASLFRRRSRTATATTTSTGDDTDG